MIAQEKTSNGTSLAFHEGEGKVPRGWQAWNDYLRVVGQPDRDTAVIELNKEMDLWRSVQPVSALDGSQLVRPDLAKAKVKADIYAKMRALDDQSFDLDRLAQYGAK